MNKANNGVVLFSFTDLRISDIFQQAGTNDHRLPNSPNTERSVRIRVVSLCEPCSRPISQTSPYPLSPCVGLLARV